MNQAGTAGTPRWGPVIRPPQRRSGMPIAGQGLPRGMTTVGFIGSGNIGGTVARLAAAGTTWC